MSEKVCAARHRWQLVVPVPPREVFAVFEQMCGTPPFRFEVLGPASARIVEVERLSLLGHWRRLPRLDREGAQRTDREGDPVWKTAVRWVSVEAVEGDAGTAVTVVASRGLRGPLGLLPTRGGRPTVRRALQLVQVLSRGANDRRSVYGEKRIPPGPVTLVASWAGMLYPLYLEPRYGAPRGEGVHTASRMEAVETVGPFVKVRLADGTEGYVERDQMVPGPTEATRAAQLRAARTA